MNLEKHRIWANRHRESKYFNLRGGPTFRCPNLKSLHFFLSTKTGQKEKASYSDAFTNLIWVVHSVWKNIYASSKLLALSQYNNALDVITSRWSFSTCQNTKIQKVPLAEGETRFKGSFQSCKWRNFAARLFLKKKKSTFEC